MKLVSRRGRARLRPDDFDDVQYSVEVVRLGKSSDGSSDRMELLESAFVVLVGVAFIVGAVVAGIVALETTTAMASEAMWYLLPMVLLPIVWLGVLHAWETLVLTPKHTTDTVMEPSAPTSKPRASKVAIF